jgi:hypothetical protein
MSVCADSAEISLIPDTIMHGSGQTLTIIGLNTQFLGFGELLLPVTTVGFIAANGEVIRVPAGVLSNYALHIADLSSLKPGVYDIEVRNENQDAYRLTNVSLTVVGSVSMESTAGYTAVPEGLEQNVEQPLGQNAITYILTVNAGAGGSILSVPDRNIGEFLFSIVPDDGYNIADVIVDGESIGAVTEYLFDSVHANRSISALFEMIPVVERCITATAGPGGSIAPSGVVCVPEGTALEFVITADEKSMISDLLVDGIFVGASNSYAFESVNNDHSITAFFALIPVPTSCTTAVAGSGGTIIPSGRVCSSGEDITFSIVPDDGYTVADVMVNDKFIGPVLKFAITEPTGDHTVFVSFVHQ